MARTVSFDAEESLSATDAPDATVSPLTTAVQIGGQLPAEPVVEWLVRWNSPVHTKHSLAGPQHHLTEVRKRPSLEAALPAARRSHVFLVEIPPAVLKEQAHDKHHQPQASVLRTREHESLLGDQYLTRC